MKRTIVAMSVMAAYGLLGHAPFMIPMIPVKTGEGSGYAEGWDG